MLNDLNGRVVYWTRVALIACGEVCCYSLNVCTEIDWPWCNSVLRRVRMQFECIVAKLDNLTSIPKAQLLLHDKCRTGAAWFTLMLRRNSLAKSMQTNSKCESERLQKLKTCLPPSQNMLVQKKDDSSRRVRANPRDVLGWVQKSSFVPVVRDPDAVDSSLGQHRRLGE